MKCHIDDIVKSLIAIAYWLRQYISSIFVSVTVTLPRFWDPYSFRYRSRARLLRAREGVEGVLGLTGLRPPYP